MLRLQQLRNLMTAEQKTELANRQAQRDNDPMRQAFNTMLQIQRDRTEAFFEMPNDESSPEEEQSEKVTLRA